MHLSSSLEPAGPKSTRHYLILHHNKRRDLVKLPETYADLVKRVQRLYHLDSDRFYVESKELNLCAGERVRIPEDAWSDIGQLLGNLFVVAEDAFDDHPESHPDCHQAPVHAANQGALNLEAPLVKDEILAVNIGDIDMTNNLTPSTEFNIQALDETKNRVISVTFNPHSGLTSLTSSTNNSTTTHTLKEAFPLQTDHHIFVYKQETRFQVLFDSHFVGMVEAPVHAPITSITYDLGGTESPFKAPISARIFSGPTHLRSEFKPYLTAFPPLDKETLYQQILACNPGNSAKVSAAMETIRNEATTFNNSSSGVKWRGKTMYSAQWEKSDWELQIRSVYVLRYTLLKTPEQPLYVIFGPQGNKYSLHIEMASDNTANFSDHTSSGSVIRYHTIKLNSSMHAVGKHSIALINLGNKLQAIFDFKQATVLNKTTIFERMPKETFHVTTTNRIEVDVFEF